jgi:D-serine deaminase-like pyridoxal phosphate-dependent protein
MPLSIPPPITNESDVPSPALLLYSERIDANLRGMVEMVGDPKRLRPHVKTHKIPQIVSRQVALGVTKAKCATIAEAEMSAGAGATDVLLAQQPVGPNVARLLALQRAFPHVAFSTLADDPGAVEALSRGAQEAGQSVEVFIDLDIGMHRTGIAPGPDAVALYRQICSAPGLRAGGLHAYDGHLHQHDVAERTTAYEACFAPVDALRTELERLGLPVPRIIAGGTPTFPMHARHAGIECSPGTTVIHDAGYGTKVPDLPFQPAAMLLTRVISKPSKNRLCLDLGHKAVAAEMPHPRAIFPMLEDAQAVVHSEEHLVLETTSAGDIKVGAVLYAVPWHICPTVNLHSEAWLVRDNRAIERWPIVGRARRITI